MELTQYIGFIGLKTTYRNKNNDTTIRGSEFKLNINMDVIDEQHMEDVEFFCTFKADGKMVTTGRLKEYINDNTPILQEDILRILI